MSTDVLEKLKQLPPEKQEMVDDFIAFMLEKYSFPEETGEALIEKRKKNMGWAKGKIWMADDFNETTLF